MEPAPWETLSLHHDERAVCDDPRRTFEVIRGEWKLNDIVEQGQELPHLLQVRFSTFPAGLDVSHSISLLNCLSDFFLLCCSIQ